MTPLSLLMSEMYDLPFPADTKNPADAAIRHWQAFEGKKSQNMPIHCFVTSYTKFDKFLTPTAINFEVSTSVIRFPFSTC